MIFPHTFYQRIRIEYRTRKQLREPDLRPWEFVVQMLVSAYLSWRWLGAAGKFRPWSLKYWMWLAGYSSLTELRTRASLADDVNNRRIIRVGPNQRFIQVTPNFNGERRRK